MHSLRGLFASCSILALTITGFALSGCSEDRVAAPEPAREAADAAAPADRSFDLASQTQRDDDALLDDCPEGAVAISGPTVIDEPGVYRVVEDFSVDAATGDGIVVRASHVLLWLGTHRLTGPGAMTGRGIVLQNVSDVLVQGGRLETFGVGVALDGATRCAVRGVRVEGADDSANPPAVPPQVGILLVNSAHNRIARNQLERVNLGLFIRGAGSYENVLSRNRVVGGSNGLLGVCYNPAGGGGPEGPTRDRVANNLFSRFGTGIQTSEGSAQNLFVGNVIEYFVAAWQDLNGTNTFRNNRTVQVAP